MAQTGLSPGPTLTTPNLQHDVSGWTFGGLLAALGVLWFTLPLGDSDRWFLAFALIMGALYWSQHIATTENIPSPLAQLTRGLN